MIKFVLLKRFKPKVRSEREWASTAQVHFNAGRTCSELLAKMTTNVTPLPVLSFTMAPIYILITWHLASLRGSNQSWQFNIVLMWRLMCTNLSNWVHLRCLKHDQMCIVFEIFQTAMNLWLDDWSPATLKFVAGHMQSAGLRFDIPGTIEHEYMRPYWSFIVFLYVAEC